MSSKVLAWVLGTGLALFAIHWAEQPFINYIFLPSLGIIITAFTLLLYYFKLKQFPSFGSKLIYIPMLVIVASITGRMAIDFSAYTFAGAVFGVMLFATYVASRSIGRHIFLAFIPFVAVVAISCIVNGIVNPGHITGGIITNYCASAGFMIFGTIVNNYKWQWLLATLVLVALFFVGAIEGLFIIGVLGITLLVRRDWSKKLLVTSGVGLVIVVIWVVLGFFTPLWGKYNFTVLKNIVEGNTEMSSTSVDTMTTGRWINIINRMKDIQPLGRGFWITMPTPATHKVEYYSDPSKEPVHNVPLVIVDQIGLLAGISWLLVTIFCLIKTKWKYAWITILAMGVFDHYIWTQFAPYWWALVGVSTTSTIKIDYIFKEVKD